MKIAAIRKTVSYACLLAALNVSAPLYAADDAGNSIEINLDVLSKHTTPEKTSAPAHAEKPQMPKPAAAAPAKKDHHASPATKKHEKPAQAGAPKKDSGSKHGATKKPTSTSPHAPSATNAPEAQKPATPKPEAMKGLPPELTPSQPLSNIPAAVVPALPAEMKPAPDAPVPVAPAPTVAPTGGIGGQLTDFVNGKPALPETAAPGEKPPAPPAPPTAAETKPALPEIPPATPMGSPLPDAKLETPPALPAKESKGMSVEGLPSLPAEAPKTDSSKTELSPSHAAEKLPVPAAENKPAGLPSEPAPLPVPPSSEKLPPLSESDVKPADKTTSQPAPVLPSSLPKVDALPSLPSVPPTSTSEKPAEPTSALPTAPVETPSLPPLSTSELPEPAAEEPAPVHAAPAVPAESDTPKKTAVLPDLAPLPENGKGDLTLPSGTQADLLAAPQKLDAGKAAAAELAAKAREEDPDIRLVFNETETDVPTIMYGQLDSLAQKLINNPKTKANVMSFSGTKKETGIYPKRVSLARGIAVRNYLTTTKGIDIERVTVRALGNKSEGGPTERVDVFIVNQ